MFGKGTVSEAAARVTAAAADTKQSIVIVGLVAVVGLVIALVGLALGAAALRVRKLATA